MCLKMCCATLLLCDILHRKLFIIDTHCQIQFPAVKLDPTHSLNVDIFFYHLLFGEHKNLMVMLFASPFPCTMNI